MPTTNYTCRPMYSRPTLIKSHFGTSKYIFIFDVTLKVGVNCIFAFKGSLQAMPLWFYLICYITECANVT